MKEIINKCDIHDLEHGGVIKTKTLPLMFDHDQEDGKSKTIPYFEQKSLEICESCFKYMTENKRIIHAYGAMGYNTYYLKDN